jgi:hypothetical protein
LRFISPFKGHLSPDFRSVKDIVADLFDMVNHALQEPLDIYFGFAPEGKSVQALLGSEVGQDWFRHGETLREDLSPPFTGNLAGHPLGKVREFYPDGHPEISLFAEWRRSSSANWSGIQVFLFLPVRQVKPRRAAKYSLALLTFLRR